MKKKKLVRHTALYESKLFLLVVSKKGIEMP